MVAKDLGLITGSVATPTGGAEDVYVALFEVTDGGPVLTDADRLDAVVRSYVFVTDAARPHFIVAFQDLDGDQVPDGDEPAGILGHPDPFVLESRERREGQDIRLGDAPLASLGIDFAALDLTTFDKVPIAAGTVATLEHPRFSEENAVTGMWAPLTAMREVGVGVYFLGAYDPDRVPVLFVHGVGGVPQDFRYLIDSLDDERFQAWVYHYPSGFRLERAARALARLIATLQREHRVKRLVLVAHSMGGLVARSALRQIGDYTDRSPVDLLVTFSTPWEGHETADWAVKFDTVWVSAWHDLQPGSEFLEDLRTELPSDVPHHLFFSYRMEANPLMRYCQDGTVSVASQLDRWHQERAEQIYGFDVGHMEILDDEDVARTFNEVLAASAR